MDRVWLDEFCHRAPGVVFKESLIIFFDPKTIIEFIYDSFERLFSANLSLTCHVATFQT